MADEGCMVRFYRNVSRHLKYSGNVFFAAEIHEIAIRLCENTGGAGKTPENPWR